MLRTLKEIESLFEFGGEIVPFLEELFGFLNDLIPVLTKVSHSLEDTTATMPVASDSIASAEMMAEDATNTIMDHLDQITTDLGKLVEGQPEGSDKETLKGVIDRVSEIHIALQFQDITSQHLHQATQIVEAIQVRMEKLFNSLQSIGEKNEMVKIILENYAQLSAEEEAIDTTDTIRDDDNITQADIDALFGG
ncbi:MAG: hypothetical protein V3W14_09765 [Candidatus Neomarinimicrobiota bacterium]